MASTLTQLQRAIADRLSADPLFSEARHLSDGSYLSIPVFCEDVGDVQEEINKIFPKLGIGCVIAIVSATPGKPNIRGPYFTRIKFILRIGENVLLNRGTRARPSASGTLISGSEVGERAHALLHQWTPDNLSAPILSVDMVQRSPGGKIAGWDCEYETQGGLTYVLPELETPPLTQSAPLTLSIASYPTPGAAIFYTVDGRGPTPRSGTLYTAPVTLDAPKNIQARAWLAGYQTSETATLAITT